MSTRAKERLLSEVRKHPYSSFDDIAKCADVPRRAFLYWLGNDSKFRYYYNKLMDAAAGKEQA